MYIKKSYPINQLRDYSSLFTRSEINRLKVNDFSSINSKIDRYGDSKEKLSYLDYLKYVYHVLLRHYPNEYIYKNEFLNQCLIKDLGNGKSVVFSEFRLGKAIADLVMFNGTSKVFEIKTVLDSDFRLSSQIIEYKKIFNEVYVIVPEVNLSKYSVLDSEIGIIVYDESGRKFNHIRKPIENPLIDCDSLMNVLHTKEYISIVKQYYGFIPKISDFNKFNVCKEMISQIPSELLNELFIGMMKKRKMQNNFSVKDAKYFNQVYLSLKFKKEEKQNLIYNLNQPINY